MVAPDRPEFVTVSSDGTARLWDLATGAASPAVPTTAASSPATSRLRKRWGPLRPPAGVLTIGGRDGRLATWSFAEVASFNGRASRPTR